MKKSIRQILCVQFAAFFFTNAYSQRLSRNEADNKAATALQDAIAAYKPVADSEWTRNTIVYKNYVMPFDYIVYGKKPADGRSLYISLHGGGNAPAKVNDQQWRNQHFLYKPAEGVYLVPRAPTNTWNLWHEDHIDNMLESIIKDTVVFKDVNPNKIYILGYSAGGDGVYQLATRMADHWAAASMMAGHPGDAAAMNLRNLPFAIFVGGLDSAYDRNKLAQGWKDRLDSLRKTDTSGYIHDVHIYPDKPHWMDRKDTVAIEWMAKFRRNPLPAKVVWIQDDRHRDQFYWLGADSANIKTGDTAIVSFKGNTINIEQNSCKTLNIF